MRMINIIIIHFAETPEGKDISINTVRDWHMEKGFSDIGYHYLISLDGGIHQGRSISKAGAHCKGQNKHSIGICYVGGIDKNGNLVDTRTDEQKIAIKDL